MIKTILKEAQISRRHFNYLLNGERNATKNVALRLQKVLGGRLSVWGYGTKEERQKRVEIYLYFNGGE
jgi:hypothetical protein